MPPNRDEFVYSTLSSPAGAEENGIRFRAASGNEVIMGDPAEPSNPFFRLVIVAGAAFVVTILALVAAIFGDPRAPVAIFLDKHGGTIIVAEVSAILALGLLALVIDRRQTLRAVAENNALPDPEALEPATPDPSCQDSY
jgi:hypothetical protein